MTKPACRIECQWTDVEATNGRLDFTLINTGGVALADFELTYTSLTRADDLKSSENCSISSRDANNHRIAPPAGLSLAPGERWSFAITSLTRKAVHRTDGISSAFISLTDGTHFDADIGDLLLSGRAPEMPPQLIPEGRLDLPLALIPWPNEISAGGFEAAPVALYPDADNVELVIAAAETSALAKRLYPNSMPPFALVEANSVRKLLAQNASDLPSESYTLKFESAQVTISYADKAGLTYGLISLAQMLHGAHTKPDTFKFPTSGSIEDIPRYSWRGCHLDVSRQIYPLSEVERFIDILAWNKMNVFHWHLTDDEGWRLEIKAYPELTQAGAYQGPDAAMPAQLGTGAKGTGGYYTQAEVAQLIEDAARLNVEIVPELDIPGHCTAVLAALPYLVDAEEEEKSYHSVQGYANNALNPAMDETYTFLNTVLDEVTALFPSKYLHIGGDEVANGSWLKSPKAQALMKEVKLDGTPELQSYMLGQVQSALGMRGKSLSGWNEVSHGGGVDAEGTLLMAWEKPEVGIALAEEGYDVVMCPGQAYYLDMVQHEAWLEPGASWAGTVTPEHTYTYEAEGDFPEELRPRLKGVQACIWSENLTSRERFNHMVFPRLSAIAEAGWTRREHKDWQRFAAICRIMPIL